MADRMTKSVVVHGDVSELYRLFEHFENFPLFMKNIKSITRTGERMSHWVMQGPLGKELEWDAQTTVLDRDERIAWESTGGDIGTRGEVTFQQLPENEVKITVTLEYTPPGGKVGEVVAPVVGQTEQRLAEDLQNFRIYAEGQLYPLPPE